MSYQIMWCQKTQRTLQNSHSKKIFEKSQIAESLLIIFVLLKPVSK